MVALGVRNEFDKMSSLKKGLHPISALPADDMLVRRLGNFARLTVEEQALLRKVARERVRTLGPRADLIHEGEAPQAVYLVLSGWACRHKVLEDGRRQIVAFLVPGDLSDLNNFVLRTMDHSIAAITDLVFAEIAHDRLARIADGHPRIAHALWWDALVSAAVQREWTVNVGVRSAFERIGHLFCELFLRLRGVGLTRGDSCDMPITQAELAEATGMTPVHVNRTLQDMRAGKLIVLKDRVLTIPDLPALQQSVLFSADYLHLADNATRHGTGHPAMPEMSGV
jgi:CRP-like cAMP-binding protein